MKKLKQLKLFRRDHVLHGRSPIKLSTLIDESRLSVSTISLYERMQHVHSLMGSLRSAREWDLVHRLQPVFRRLCWPGALASLPTAIYEAHIHELVTRVRESRALEHATQGEILWMLAQAAEKAPLSEEAADVMEQCAKEVFGALDHPTEIVPIRSDRGKQLMTELRLQLAG